MQIYFQFLYYNKYISVEISRIVLCFFRQNNFDIVKIKVLFAKYLCLLITIFHVLKLINNISIYIINMFVYSSITNIKETQSTAGYKSLLLKFIDAVPKKYKK